MNKFTYIIASRKYNTGRFDWTHANAIWFDEDDSAIYLSSRHINRITKISYPGGEIIWNLGHELGSGDIDCGQDIGFSFQHSVTKLPNGNILTFDNGNLSREFLNQDIKTSRSIEIDVTETDSGCEAELAWEYILPEELYGYLSGNTQKLENGNYLSTTIGGGGTSLEVDANKNSVWQANYNLSLPDGLVYRAMRIPGLFPIAYSVIFPQFESSVSEINLESDVLEVFIKNNGDYIQLFNYQLDAISNQNGYNVTFTITPEHFPHEIKTTSFNIIVPDNSNFILENHQGQLSLNSNESIFLLFDDSVLGYEEQQSNLNFNLHKPYPNPFNPTIHFNVELLNREYINIDVYNIEGEKIDKIFSGYLNKGQHLFNWNGESNSTGLYIIKAQTKNNSLTQKITLVK